MGLRDDSTTYGAVRVGTVVGTVHTFEACNTEIVSTWELDGTLSIFGQKFHTNGAHRMVVDGPLVTGNAKRVVVFHGAVHAFVCAFYLVVPVPLHLDLGGYSSMRDCRHIG